jgi:hypothetical protein
LREPVVSFQFSEAILKTKNEEWTMDNGQWWMRQRRASLSFQLPVFRGNFKTGR